jgi:hypothetical protein
MCRIADVAALHKYAQSCIFGLCRDKQCSLLLEASIAHIADDI